jgi:glycosyltransferase involved in cell wall biosynthesis
LRLWDYESSTRVDHFIANAIETQKRITKFYRRDSDVIYPPVSIPKEPTTHNSQPTTYNYYITTSRLARAKHIDILIQAANRGKFQLKVIGSGRDAEYLKSIAGPTVQFLSNLPDDQFEEVSQGAKAYLFASVDEEFGIAPIEAMGYGIPVIAYASGGLVETVSEGKNGYLYDELNDQSLLEKIHKLEKLSEKEYDAMRKHARQEAEKYSFETFKKHILEFIQKHS